MVIKNPSGGNRARSYEENKEEYRIYSLADIGSILREIQSKRQMIRMAFPDRTETLMTSVLNVDMQEKCMFLEASSVQAENELVLQSKVIRFEAILDGIRISFIAGNATPGSYRGVQVFRFPFPENMLRMQRRKFERFEVPNARVHVPLGSGKMVFNFVGQVRDLSTNGMCLVDPAKTLDDTVGLLYKNCSLQLPGMTAVTVTLEVRNSYEAEVQKGMRQHRIGCQFHDVSSADITLIQRYIASSGGRQGGM